MATRIPNDQPAGNLVCAIIAQAVRDYRRRDYYHVLAKEFLESKEAEEWATGWGINLTYIRKKLKEKQ